MCGSSALWHCLLACGMNLRFNKMHVRQDRKFQAQRDLHLQCLCKMHRCVELCIRVCTRQSTRHGQWLCNEKAIAVLARRRSEILERCGKLFSIHEFCWKHLCCLSSWSRYFSTDSLTLFFCFVALEFVYKTLPQIFFIRSQNLVAFERRQDWLKKGYFPTFPNI